MEEEAGGSEYAFASAFILTSEFFFLIHSDS